MLTNKVVFYLSLLCFCLLFSELPQTSAIRLPRSLYDGSLSTDGLEESDLQLIMDTLSRLSPDFQRRYASKRGFVRLG
ncbi:unnamed protein product [Rodentolepis nana]|uniref:Neuropeptide F n=1 Tax=Rodentolepis nana TaxID=102285 RepID=A0A0R3TKC4_RODNA|nr:unnamed protein product [Rodentolepis nana]